MPCSHQLEAFSPLVLVGCSPMLRYIMHFTVSLSFLLFMLPALYQPILPSIYFVPCLVFTVSECCAPLSNCSLFSIRSVCLIIHLWSIMYQCIVSSLLTFCCVIYTSSLMHLCTHLSLSVSVNDSASFFNCLSPSLCLTHVACLCLIFLSLHQIASISLCHFACLFSQTCGVSSYYKGNTCYALQLYCGLIHGSLSLDLSLC